jgi:hypothetical protein
MHVTLAGIASNGNCDHCYDLNGTYVLDWWEEFQLLCFWRYRFSSPICGFNCLVVYGTSAYTIVSLSELCDTPDVIGDPTLSWADWTHGVCAANGLIVPFIGHGFSQPCDAFSSTATVTAV